MSTMARRLAVALGAAAAIAGASGLPGCGGGGSGVTPTSSVLGVRAESEPNDTTATATPFTLTQVAAGTIAASTTTADVDQWSFTANAGALLDLEVYGVRADYTTWALAGAGPRLELRGPGGAVVGEVDCAYTGYDPTDVGFRKLYLPESGTYTLRVIPFDDDGDDAGSGRYFFTSALSTPTLVVASPQTTTTAAVDLGPSDQTVVATFDPSGSPHVYRVAVAAGEVLHVETFAARNRSRESSPQISSWDPVVHLLGTDGATTLARFDDSVHLDSDGRQLLATAGSYFLRVSDSSGDLTTATAYTLAVSHEAPALVDETEPNGTTASAASAGALSPDALCVATVTGSSDVDLFRIELVRGELIAVQVLDPRSTLAGTALTVNLASNVGTNFSSVPEIESTGVRFKPFLATSAGPIHVKVSRGASGVYPYSLRYARALLPEEAEPNDTTATATPILVRAPKFGTIAVAGDVDHWSFQAEADAAYVVTIEASSTIEQAYDHPERLVSDLDDPRISVAGPDGGEVAPQAGRGIVGSGAAPVCAISLADPAHHAQAAFVASAPGAHVIRVDSRSGSAGSTRLYTVLVEKR